MSTEGYDGRSRNIYGNEGKTDSHDPFECAWLPPRVPLETVESVIIPEVLREKDEELYVRNG
jgi:hypothetical protein